MEHAIKVETSYQYKGAICHLIYIEANPEQYSHFNIYNDYLELMATVESFDAVYRYYDELLEGKYA